MQSKNRILFKFQIAFHKILHIRLQGTIQQLDGGFSLIALEDLTGGIGEYISLNDGSIQSSQLFEMLMRLNKQCFVSLGTGKVICSIKFGGTL